MSTISRRKVLITGGAGFIGSHTADELEKRGYKIRILDNLNPKTHFNGWPAWVRPSWEKIKGDVRSRATMVRALKGVDYVIHLAAMMDLMPVYSQFMDTNVTSTALIYELIAEKKLPIKKVIVASSQFVYGEGRGRCKIHGVVNCEMRREENLKRGKWQPVCPSCGKEVVSLKLVETHQDPANQYSISKYAQEMIALKLGRLNNIPSVAMRYSIVHGPRQSLKDAYSGALRIFTLQMLLGRTPSIYEDGGQLRDYVSVYDVARANALVLEDERADYENFNVGGGKGITVLNLAKMIAAEVGWKEKLTANGEYRVGDIRDAVSDISKLQSLGWKVQMTEGEVVKEYISGVREQKLDKDYAKEAEEQMKKAGVIRRSGVK